MALEDKDFIEKQISQAAKGLGKFLTKESFEALFTEEPRVEKLEKEKTTENQTKSEE